MKAENLIILILLNLFFTLKTYCANLSKIDIQSKGSIPTMYFLGSPLAPTDSIFIGRYAVISYLLPGDEVVGGISVLDLKDPDNIKEISRRIVTDYEYADMVYDRKRKTLLLTGTSNVFGSLVQGISLSIKKGVVNLDKLFEFDLPGYYGTQLNYNRKTKNLMATTADNFGALNIDLTSYEDIKISNSILQKGAVYSKKVGKNYYFLSKHVDGMSLVVKNETGVEVASIFSEGTLDDPNNFVMYKGHIYTNATNDFLNQYKFKKGKIELIQSTPVGGIGCNIKRYKNFAFLSQGHDGLKVIDLTSEEREPILTYLPEDSKESTYVGNFNFQMSAKKQSGRGLVLNGYNGLNFVHIYFK